MRKFRTLCLAATLLSPVSAWAIADQDNSAISQQQAAQAKAIAAQQQRQSVQSSNTNRNASASSAQGGAGGNAAGGAGGKGGKAVTGAVTVTQTYSGADPAAGAGGYAGGSYTVRNVPDVVPPSIVGGNPCTVGASGGVGTAGLGVSIGASWADQGCERRQGAALLWNMGKINVAAALLCQDEHIREAMREAGEPCPADRPQQPAPAAQGGLPYLPPQPGAAPRVALWQPGASQ